MDNATIDLQHQFYDMLMQSQYWSAERMRDYQRSQLTHLLRHAKKNVPFYENRLDAVLRPNGEIDWDRWGEIPIVKRSDMIEHRAAMLARELPPGHGGVTTTRSSGSTGLPIQTTYNDLVMTCAQVNVWRSHRWQEVDWSQLALGRRVRDAQRVSLAPNGTDRGIWGPYWDEGARRGDFVDAGAESSVAEVVDLMERRRPRYVYGMAKLIHLYALEVEQRGKSITLDGCFAYSERVGPEDVDACRRVFGSPIFDMYSSKEGGRIAHQCAAVRGLHVNSESILVEIVDQFDQPVSPGEDGRVIITPFFSTAQPLIRYDQGDLSSWASACTCGRHLPLLDGLKGRVSAAFHHPDGRRVHRFLPDSVRDLLHCSMWQIAQVGPLAFEVRYLPLGQQTPDTEAAESIFRRTYFDDAEVRFVPVQSFRTTEAGKYLAYVDETRLTTLA